MKSMWGKQLIVTFERLKFQLIQNLSKMYVADRASEATLELLMLVSDFMMKSRYRLRSTQ